MASFSFSSPLIIPMASFSFSLNPISKISYFSLNFTDQPLNFHVYCQNVSFLRNGFHCLGLNIRGRCSRQARAVPNSTRIQALIDSVKISDVPVFTPSEAFEKLKAKREIYKGNQQYLAMYSSVFGGIITDPAAMVIPIDDHMVHRGHGVFDTAAIVNGYLYELDQHLDRFLNSASVARIKLPFDRKTIRNILIQTVSVSQCKAGSLRYLLSSGPGDFQLAPSICDQPALYAIVIQDHSPVETKGVKVVTSSIPIKPPPFATMKSVNYLPNTLSKMEAEEKGGYAAIWLDQDGFIAEGQNMNVAFVSKENELLMPQFDKVVSSCAANRVLVFANELVKEGKLKGIRVGNVTVEEGLRAAEMMLIGSGTLVRSVVQWDDHVINDGKEGPVSLALLDLLLEDMNSGPPSVRTPVPY